MSFLDGIRNVKWPLGTDALRSTVYQECRRRIVRSAGAAVSAQPWKVVTGGESAPGDDWFDVDLSSAVGANPQSGVICHFTIVNVAQTGEAWNIYAKPKGTGGEGFEPLIIVGAGENRGSHTFRRLICVPVGTGGVLELNLNDTDDTITSITYRFEIPIWFPENVNLNLA